MYSDVFNLSVTHHKYIKIQHSLDLMYQFVESTYLHIHWVFIFTHDSRVPNLVIFVSLITHSTNSFRSFDDVGTNSCAEKW